MYGPLKEEESWRIRTNEEIRYITKGRHCKIYKSLR
jgi:hypothetical protein